MLFIYILTIFYIKSQYIFKIKRKIVAICQYSFSSFLNFSMFWWHENNMSFSLSLLITCYSYLLYLSLEGIMFLFLTTILGKFLKILPSDYFIKKVRCLRLLPHDHSCCGRQKSSRQKRRRTPHHCHARNRGQYYWAS